MINDQTVDTKVAELMGKVQELRDKAKAKQDEALKLGNYKTNCSFTMNGQRFKISTLDIPQLVEIGEYILEKNRVRGEAVSRLGLSGSIASESAKIEGSTVDEWFYDLKICVIKRESLRLNKNADILEQKTLTLESEINKRNRNADNLLKAFENGDFSNL